MDFVHDQLADERSFRVLTVVDQWSRQSPILEPAFAIGGREVAAVLDRLGPALRSITVNHGTEFTSRALEDWVHEGDPARFYPARQARPRPHPSR